MVGHLGAALAGSMKQRGSTLGRDVAIVISSDGTHCGAGFPALPVKGLGMGATCPINLYHFVSFPSVAYVNGEAMV